jgi:hypothetical protein
MRIHIRVLMIALLTLGWSGVALSEDSVKTPFNSASAAHMDGLSLDLAFEEATSPQHHGKLKNLGGPTSMECQHPATKSDLETCVVTADGMLVSLPAALAQH